MNDDILKEFKYNSAMMEQVLSEVKALHELVSAQPTLADFYRLEGKVDDVNQRMGVVEAAVKDVSRDLDAHKHDDRMHFIPSVPHPRRA